MSAKTKTLVSYNIHALLLDAEKHILDGWRVSPSIAARRSLGNRITVVLTKDDEAEASALAETTAVSTEEVKVADETPQVEVQSRPKRQQRTKKGEDEATAAVATATDTSVSTSDTTSE